VCGQLDHLAARCPSRVPPTATAAAAIAPWVEGDEPIDEREFRAFQEWRAGSRGGAKKTWVDGSSEEAMSGCALGAIALLVGSGQASAERKRVQQGPPRREGNRPRPAGGFAHSVGARDMALSATGEFRSSIDSGLEAQERPVHRHQECKASIDVAPHRDKVAVLKSASQMVANDTMGEAVRVDIGVLLELTSQAGLNLEDVAAMTEPTSL
jgi:hypothetical protein